MDFYQNVKPLEDKLAALLVDESMVHALKTSQYPILLTVSQDVSPEAQMELFCTRGNGISSRDALLQFIFKLDGMEIRTDNRLIISDNLMNKIKNHAKKIYHAYLEGFFAEHICNMANKECSPNPVEAPYTAPEETTGEADDFAEFFDEADTGTTEAAKSEE